MTADVDTLRLFLALWPDAGTRAALARCREAWQWPLTARPQADQRLHLTLHFLGAVARSRLAELRHALRPRCEPFTLRLDEHRLWPRGGAVLVPAASPPALTTLHAQLGDRLDRLDLPTERRGFEPHVTLARSAAGAPVPAPPLPVHWPVSGFALVQTLPVTGDYRVLWQYGFNEPMAGPAAAR